MRSTEIFIFIAFAKGSLSCIPVSLPDDTDGFTTTASSVDTTTTSTAATTTTTATCLATCNPVSSFTDCATATAVPADHTCQTVSPTPTSTRSGSACTFALDCSSLGPSSYPIFISGGVANTQTGNQVATLTCSDGSFNWMDNIIPQTDDMAVCGYANCLSTCPSISAFTDCMNTAVTMPLTDIYKYCDPVSPTPTNTRTGTTCSFTLTCTSPSTVHVINGITATDTGMMSVTFNCADFASAWSNGMPRDYGVCAMP